MGSRRVGGSFTAMLYVLGDIWNVACKGRRMEWHIIGIDVRLASPSLCNVQANIGWARRDASEKGELFEREDMRALVWETDREGIA